jgi:hypothetical protein
LYAGERVVCGVSRSDVIAVGGRHSRDSPERVNRSLTIFQRNCKRYRTGLRLARDNIGKGAADSHGGPAPRGETRRSYVFV